MKAWVQAPRACMLTLMAVMLMVAPLAESLATKMQSAGVLNLLRKAQPEDVVMHPYPYIVIKDAWPKPLYDRLSREFPSIKAITSGPGIPGAGRKVHANARMDISAIRSLRHPGKVLTPLWTQVVKYHVSQAFYREVLRVFGPAIREVRPGLEKQMMSFRQHKLEEAKLAVRYTETEKDDLRVDCQVGINTPSRGKQPLGVRGPHHDRMVEIWAGLLYMRDDKDRSTGAALSIYKCKAGKYTCKEIPDEDKAKYGMSTRQNHEQYRRSDLAVVNTVPYSKNTFVMFINTNFSIHGVSPRSPSPLSRRLVNVIGEQALRADLLRTKKTGLAGLNLNPSYP